MTAVFSSCFSVRCAVWLAVLLMSSIQACYIRNCPRGGKRSMDSQLIPHKQCMSCGPQDEGQCVGPNICCSHKFGCLFGTRATLVCQHEDDSVTPCFVSGAPCGEYDRGNCVADGICCDSESCAVNERCRKSESQQQYRKSDVLSLVEQLLRKSDDKTTL